MAESYIRTPDRNESRGPFTSSELLTLAEAEQITVNTLYYDEPKKEWVPIGINPELKDEVFPEREKLKLEINQEEDSKKTSKKKKSATKKKKRITVSDMLAVAETETKHARSRRRRERSLKYAVILNNYGLTLIMLLFAAILIASHLDTVRDIFATKQFNRFLNYPLLGLALIDILMAVSAYLGSRGLYSLLRGRAMLTLGFGVYAGWALSDSQVLMASRAAGLGAFATTLSSRLLLSVLLVGLGLGGSGFLAYLAVNGYFNGFLDNCFLEIVSM